MDHPVDYQGARDRGSPDQRHVLVREEIGPDRSGRVHRLHGDVDVLVLQVGPVGDPGQTDPELVRIVRGHVVDPASEGRNPCHVDRLRSERVRVSSRRTSGSRDDHRLDVVQVLPVEEGLVLEVADAQGVGCDGGDGVCGRPVAVRDREGQVGRRERSARGRDGDLETAGGRGRVSGGD